MQPGAETTQDTIHTFLSPYFKSTTKLIWQNCNLHLADKQGEKEAVLTVFVLPITAPMYGPLKTSSSFKLPLRHFKLKAEGG